MLKCIRLGKYRTKAGVETPAFTIIKLIIFLQSFSIRLDIFGFKNIQSGTSMIHSNIDKFGVGYAQAATMIDTLAEKGYIKHDGKQWINLQ